MNSHRQTKRALLTSVMALVMCVVMLLGTTFAWFTDTARTSVNKIEAGNLDVALYYGDTANGAIGTNWTELVDGSPALKFLQSNGTTATQQDFYWEPGGTYSLPALKVVNNGNLNLKYKVIISGATGDTMLLDVIDFSGKITDENNAVTDLPSVSMNSTTPVILDRELAAGKADTITLNGTMQTSANNTYMKKTVDNITIAVYATQATGEYDSTTDQYDKNAQYPEVSYAMVSTQGELNDALKDPTDANGNPTKDVAVEMPANSTFTLDNDIANESNNNGKSRNVTFIGDGSQTVDIVTKAVNAAEGNEMNYQRGSSFAFQNVTVQGGTTTYGGIVCNELTFENCTIKDKLTLYGKATFINCTFENDMADQYSIWTWGGTDVTFEGCTFNTNGKAILLYGGATASNPTNLVVNNCTFNDRNNGTAGKAAIEIGNDYNATYTLTVNNATVNGFAVGKNTTSTLWANKNSMDAAHLTVTIDGVKVQ